MSTLNGYLKSNSYLKRYTLLTLFMLMTTPVLAANNTVTLTWDEVTHADGYQLEEKLVGDADWTKIPAGTNSLTLTDRADGEYIYRVIACIEHPTDGKLCNTDVAEYSADAVVTLPSITGIEGVSWATNRVFEGDEAVFSWRITGGTECTNESGDSVASSGRITETPSSESVITKTITCNGESYSDTLAVLPHHSITLPDAIANPIVEEETVVGSIPDNFSVGPMGNAIYTMPIATAPGSGGLVPDISITYDSGSQNGLLGVGWSISGISILQKCAKTMAIDNEIGTADDKSRLCLDGKRLVTDDVDDYGLEGTTYSLVDGTPMQIVANSNVYTVTMPNSQVYTYSLHSSDIWTLTKKQDAAGNYIVFDYVSGLDYPKLKSVQYTGNENLDTSPTNAIFFHYESRNDKIAREGRNITSRLDFIQSKVNVTDLTTKESGDELRTYDIEYKSADVSGRSLIASITSCADDSSICLAPTVFDWQEGNLGFDENVDVEFESDNDRRGQRILDANGDGINDFWIIKNSSGTRSDDIRIVQGGASPRLVQSKNGSATEAFRESWRVIDFDSDGRDDVMFNHGGWKIYRSTIVNNNPATINYDFDNPISMDLPSSVDDIKLADFNGDSFPDALYYDDGALYLQYFDVDTKDFSSKVDVTPSEFILPINERLFGNRFEGFYSDRSGGVSGTLLETYFSDNNPLKNNLKIADFDGDGSSEIVMAIPYFYRNRCNDSDHFADGKKVYYGEWDMYSLENGRFSRGRSLGYWNSENYQICSPLHLMESEVVRNISFVDIDQDGRDEVVTENFIDTRSEQPDSPISISLKVGQLSSRDAPWWSQSSSVDTLNDNIFSGWLADLENYQYHYLFSDYNSDGYLDLLFYKNAEYNTDSNVEVWKVATFNGSSFDDDEYTNIEHVYKSDAINAFVELNGDGVPDYVSVTGHVKYQLSQSDKRDLLTTITNGFGQSTNIKYKSLSDEYASSLYTRENNVADLEDPRCQENGDYCASIIDVEIPINVVQQVSVADESLTNYRYKGLKVQHGVGLLGFREVVATERISDSKVTSRYHQTFPYTGKLYYTRMEQLVISEQDICSETSGGCYKEEMEGYIQLSSTEISYAEHNSTACSTDVNDVACSTYGGAYIYPEIITKQKYNVDGLNNVLSTSTTTNTNSDAYGHMGTVTEVINYGTSDVATIVTSKGYEHLDDVYGGRLTTETVTSSRPNEDTVTQVVTYTYNEDNNYLLESKEINNADNLGGTSNDSLSANFNSKEVYTRDDFGNVTFLEKTADGAIAQFTGYDYDNKGRYITDQHQYIGYSSNADDTSTLATITSSTIYHPILGLPLTITSANDQVTTNGYNALGRLNFTFNPDGSYATVTQELCSTSADCPTDGYYVETTEVSNGPNSKVYFDNKGLKLREKSQSLSDASADTISWVQKDYAYDYLNRKVVESVPHFTGDLAGISSATTYSEGNLPPEGYSLIVYDDFNRVTAVFKADHGKWSTSYDGLTSTSSNPDSHDTVTVKNVLGEVVKVTDADLNDVTYTYSALGKMRKVTRTGDSGQVVTDIAFDHLGRKVKMTDPDVGIVTYRYDGFGNLLWQQDANEQRKCSIYDSLGRVKETYHATTNTCSLDGAELDAHTKYTYDISMYGIGQVSAIYDAINKVDKQYFYNKLSQVYREELIVDDKSYFQDTVYDSDNQFRIKKTYDASSGNGGIEYHYNDDNYLVGKTDLVSDVQIWELLTTDAWGNATEFNYGNGISTTKFYDNYDGTISSITANSGSIQNSEYHFSNIGNLDYRKDHRAESGFEESFNYDALNRLDDWTKTGGGASGTIDVNYDRLGNIAFKTGVGTYHYDDLSHAVSSITDGPLAGSFGYDNNGNMTSGGGRSSLSYNVNNKPTSITSAGNVTGFIYSIGGARIKRSDTDGTNTTDTLYIGNVEFVSKNGELTRIQRQIEGIALETYYTSTGIRGLEYLHFDHLGSAEVITDSDGAVVKRFSFDPWGQRRSIDNYATTYGLSSAVGHALNTYNNGYTGHEHLDQSGLIHMNGRVYDPRLGRFLSADPMVQQEYNLQNLNRYSYVLNNPLNATDPSGYFWAQLFSAAMNYFASDSFYQSLAMAAVSYASNGGVQFTYNSAGAFSYGQGAQRSFESQAFDSYDLGGSSRGLSQAKAQARVGSTVSSGVSGGDTESLGLNGYSGGSGDDIQEIDVTKYEPQSHSLDIGKGQTLDFDTQGPFGFASKVKKDFKSILSTPSGEIMLRSIAAGDGSLLLVYGKVNYEGPAKGYRRGIVYNHRRAPLFRSNIGDVRDSATYFALAHEVHHSWGSLTRDLWRGKNGRIDIGSRRGGKYAHEVFASRYSNKIRLESGQKYYRTHYDNIPLY